MTKSTTRRFLERRRRPALCLQNELFPSKFGSRNIALPPGTDADKVSADADNGVITITVPKGAETKAKKIAVKPK